MGQFYEKSSWAKKVPQNRIEKSGVKIARILDEVVKSATFLRVTSVLFQSESTF